MSMTRRMLASWRRPRVVMRGLLEGPPREDRALVMLVLACVLIFVAQWPALSRAAHLDPSVPLDARMSGALMGVLFILPLLAYGLAALSHLVARLAGGRGTHYRARVALFWALLAVTPLMLLQGLAAGMLGPGPAVSLLGVVVLGGFLFQWGNALLVAEGRDDATG